MTPTTPITMWLTILLLVSFASEQEQIPVVGPLTLLITLLLATVVFESVGRAWLSFRRYRAETVEHESVEADRGG